MLNKYLESITKDSSQEEKSYFMFLTFMISALSYVEANKLYTKAQKVKKRISLTYEEGQIDGERYVIVS